jgi:magnesium-transporting ATPase (P-type)
MRNNVQHPRKTLAKDRLNWHSLPFKTVLETLQTSAEGLSEAECALRLQRYGPNELPEKTPDNLFWVFLRQFASPLIYLLLAASVISFLIDEYTDAFFIFFVLQLNAIIGTFQERRAAVGAAALTKLTPTRAVVRRNSQRQTVDSHALVPGDIVEISSGEKVPADLRLFDNTSVTVDESLLTGESAALTKSGDLTFSDEAGLADLLNMLFAGTTVLNGRAIGAITETGSNAELGRIAGALETAQTPPPLVIRLRLLARQITILMSVVIAILAVVLLLRGAPMSEVLLVAVALAVAAIPEGLPVAITIALSVATTRMADQHVIVRSLPAVEGLGACTVIATDKTGTLTCNELTVKQVLLADGAMITVEGEGYRAEGKVTYQGGGLDEDKQRQLDRLVLTGILCNEASLYYDQDRANYVGDTVDVAFLVLAHKLGIMNNDDNTQEQFTDRIPYEPAKRFAAVFQAGQSAGQVIAHVKGAAEVILPMCRNTDRNLEQLADGERLAAQGYRVIAVASGPVTGTDGDFSDPACLQNLELLGFVALIDPLRPEVPAAIEQCQSSGVEVKMITGDHPATALTIGRQLNLASEITEVLTGSELADILDNRDELSVSERQWDLSRIQTARIFARIDPIQKLIIVEKLQQAGHFVAVTGDGANDAPALEKAEIGVAMGFSGTDVAREAASLLLTDDNFASIVKGIEQGRIAYDNVRKVTLLLIATGIGEIVLFLFALVAGLPIPLFAVQLLWLNLVTNGLQHVALAFEKGEPDIMKRRPRPPAQPLFDTAMITQVSLAGVYIGFAAFGFYFWALEMNYSETQARTGVLFLMVLFENVHVFNCRSETRSIMRVPLRANLFVVLSVGLAISLHVLATYEPHISAILRIEPLAPELFIVIIPLALLLAGVFEIYKRFAARKVIN